MPKLNEAPLPSIGRKLWLQTAEYGRISIIEYATGEYEVYLIPAGEEFPTAAVRLSHEEARTLATAFPQPKAATEAATPLHTVVVASGSPLIGRACNDFFEEEASIAALQPLHATEPQPAGGREIQAGDTLYLVGSGKGRERIVELAQAE